MKVQILLDGEVIATRIVGVESLSPPPSLNDVKRMALNAALRDKAIRISQSLQATFAVFDANDQPVAEDPPVLRSSTGSRL